MSKKVKFIKDHVSGIGKDSVVKLEDAHADRLIKEKVAEEADEKAGYKMNVSKVTDPGKAAREVREKKAADKKKKALAVQKAKRSQLEVTGKE